MASSAGDCLHLLLHVNEISKEEEKMSKYNKMLKYGSLQRENNAIISLSTCIKSMSSLDVLTVKIGINRSDRSSAVADPAGDRPV